MSQQQTEQLPLLFGDEPITIHCFFSPRCPYVTQSEDSKLAHDLMEQHYTEKHTRDIDRIIGRLNGYKPKEGEGKRHE